MSLRLALRPLVVCSALFVFGHVARAQTKVAVINLQKAVLESAEIKAASAAMEARYKPRVTQIETLDQSTAKEAQSELSSGADFADVAQQVSVDGTSKLKGGDATLHFRLGEESSFDAWVRGEWVREALFPSFGEALRRIPALVREYLETDRGATFL